MVKTFCELPMRWWTVGRYDNSTNGHSISCGKWTINSAYSQEMATYIAGIIGTRLEQVYVGYQNIVLVPALDCGSVNVDFSNCDLRWCLYSGISSARVTFHYQYRDGYPVCEQWPEDWSQTCILQSKKIAEYTNCCQVDMKGWGKEFGARCSKDEQLLASSRSKNLCVYVGKEKVKSLGVTTVVKHHFCCFGNMLDKVVQVQGRKELGLNFGSGGSPNCRGLTFTEMQRIDWEQVDFTEFIEDFKGKFFGKYQSPNPDEIAGRVNSSMPGIRKGDDDPFRRVIRPAGAAIYLMS
jgi:hypothetical protein